MTKREAEKYIKSLDLFPGFKLERLARGNNSEVFLIVSKRKKYTLRVRREDSKHGNRLQQHYINLKFLEAEGIDFAPQAIYFDKVKNTMIATYVPGQPITNTGLNNKQLAIFLKQLSVISKLKQNNYKKLCRKYKFKIDEPETPIISIKKYGIKRFRLIEQNRNNKDIIDWIKPRLKESVVYNTSIKWNKNTLFFAHGDVTGNNIIKNKNNIYLIDWERARFVYSLNFGLSYMFIHFELFALQQNKIIRFFAKYAGLSYKTLKKDVFIGMKGIKVNDIIWAAQVYSNLYEKKERGWKKYRKMTYQRMREYEQLFEN